MRSGVMECKHTNTVLDSATTAVICSQCGLVISEQEFDTFQYAQKDISRNLPVALTDSLVHRDRFWSIYELIHSLCTRFALGDSLWQQAGKLIEKIYDQKSGLVDRGRKGRMAAAATILIINRKSSNPAGLNLTTLADAIGESRIAFGSYILKLKKEIPDLVEGEYDNLVFVENFYTNFVKPVLIKKKIPLTEPDRSIVDLSKDILALGNAAWLDTGRKADPFVTACIFLALESFLGSKAKPLTKPVKVEICQSIGITYRTMFARSEELKAFLVKESQGLLPWPIDEKNLLSHLNEVISILLVTFNAEDAVEPPSFIKSTERTNKRRLEIEAAKERLAMLKDSKAQISGSTETELLIEKLLLLGAPEDEIAGCRDNKQLSKLVEMYDTCNIVLFDDE